MRIATEYEYYLEFESICLTDLKLAALPSQIKVAGEPFTMPSDPGIGLLSDEELDRDYEPIDLPELWNRIEQTGA